jgi:hypothetical protein
MDILGLHVDQAFITWLGSGFAAFVVAGWTMFTYFDQRRRNSQDVSQSLTAAQVAAIFSALLLQAQRQHDTEVVPFSGTEWRLG